MQLFGTSRIRRVAGKDLVQLALKMGLTDLIDLRSMTYRYDIVTTT